MADVKLYSNPSLADFMRVCYQLADDEREQIEAFTGRKYDAEEMAVQHWGCPGPRWVLCVDGDPVCIGGYQQLRPGVWQDWMFNTPAAFEHHWRTITKHCRKVMSAMLKEEAHRLQCVSLASRIHAHKWYRVLGLQPEGTLHAYGVNGEDALMFYRLRAD